MDDRGFPYECESCDARMEILYQSEIPSLPYVSLAGETKYCTDASSSSYISLGL